MKTNDHVMVHIISSAVPELSVCWNNAFLKIFKCTISALPCCPAHLAVCFNVFLKHVLLAEQINEWMNEKIQSVGMGICQSATVFFLHFYDLQKYRFRQTYIKYFNKFCITLEIEHRRILFRELKYRCLLTLIVLCVIRDFICFSLFHHLCTAYASAFVV